MQDIRIKNNESMIKDNFDKFSNKNKIIQIKRAGIIARIILLLVFLAVKTFNP